MSDLTRQVFVISDLHLGGVYSDSGQPGDRGFRICTHADEVAAFIRSLAAKPAGAPAIELVINGDLVDFLAERGDPKPWNAFNADPVIATKLLRQIVERDQAVFDAMAELLDAGHRLVILLGNHDVELALPQVRRVLVDLIGAAGKDFEFIHDGEAYVVGDALIEHGNEYDDWNRVNYAQLRRIRATLSREQAKDLDFFEPPAGSHMVADIINPIKEQYKFVDLLKPETSAAFPLLLALEPSYKPMLAKAAKNKAKATDVVARRKIAHGIGADISARDSGGGSGSIGGDMGGMGGGMSAAPASPASPAGSDHDALSEVLAETLGEEVEAFHEAVGVADRAEEAIGSDISAGGLSAAIGWAKLLVSGGDSEAAVQKRVPALFQALQAVQGDKSFDRTEEAKTEYWEAAKSLAQGPIKHVVFGHTHLPKRVQLPSGGYYLNSGTWADVLRFPDDVISGSKAEAQEKVADFVDAMRNSDFSAFTLFRPTYVRLDIGADGMVAEAELCDHGSD